MKKNLLAVGCLLMACQSWAGVPTQQDTTKLVQLNEVQVKSTRAARKTPIAYTNMGKKDIQKLNVGRDIPFLMEQMPGVTTSSDAGMGIGYTGIHVRGTDPTRVNITVNGIPLNDAESNSVYWVNMGDFATNVQSIQLQRGVGTSTNGSGTFGASVNMSTDAVITKPFLQFDGSVGSYGSHKESLTFGTGLLKNHWSLNGRLSNIGSDGYIRRAFSRLNSYYLQGAYLGDKTLVRFITFNGTEKTYHAWDYATKEQMKTMGRRYNPCGQYLTSSGDTAYYSNQTDNYHQQHYQLLWNQMFNQKWNLNVALHYTRGKGYYEQLKDGWGHSGEKLYKYGLSSELGSKSALVRRKYSAADFYGTVVSLNYDNDRLQATFGGGWNEYDGDHYGTILWVRNYKGSLNPNQKYYDNDATKRDGNVYAKASYEFVKGLNGFLDLQFRGLNYSMKGPSDAYDSDKKQITYKMHESFAFFNPKAGLFWDINANNSLYASYAIAHKEPTRNDYEDAYEGRYASMPKSERLDDIEIGYKFRQKGFRAGLNYYYMKYKDQLVLTGEKNSIGEAIARNVGKSYRTGIELEADWQVCSMFNWSLNATWSHNRAKNWKVTLDDTGAQANLGSTPLSYSPEFLFNNTFSFNYKGFNAALMSHYVGEQYMTNTGFRNYDDNGKSISLMIDRYFVNNLDLGYTFKFPFIQSATIGVTVYNLFGTKYESNGTASAQYKTGANGKVMAYQDADGDSYSVYSAQAPVHFMAHLSVRF